MPRELVQQQDLNKPQMSVGVEVFQQKLGGVPAWSHQSSIVISM
jgi:hypothetical protein